MDPVDFFCITFLLRRFTELSQNMFPAEISVTWTPKKNCSAKYGYALVNDKEILTGRWSGNISFFSARFL